jgi:CHASE3 domain sensor protein
MDIKTNVPGIYRTDQGYLINKDNDGLSAYKKQKDAARKMSSIQKELLTLKNDMQEIKELLKGLVK